ncbi:MAG: methyltransferase [Rhodospirillaceae bacterium]|nr:methyltransferase [Rhodospirillaceae bacterium]
MTRLELGLKTTTDTVLGGRLKIIQPDEGYRVAIDPVLLAAAMDVSSKSRVLDVGCGTGAALFCLLARVPSIQGVGLEKQQGFAELARLGVEANDLVDRAEIVLGDVSDFQSETRGSFDAVMTNPPFYEVGTVPDRPEQNSTHAVMQFPLSTWIKKCLALLDKGGLFTIIHRAERLSDIIQSLSSCGAITVIPLWPKAGRPAGRVIVTARKGRKSPTKVHPGLVLHAEDGTYTPEADTILRAGGAFEVSP